MQLFRSSGLCFEIEPELTRVQVPEARHRGKHFCGPATKARSLLAQMDVVTTISFAVTSMTFTDDGRPPRERFDTVPAVEMTVPFRVCSA